MKERGKGEKEKGKNVSHIICFSQFTENEDLC